MAPRHGFEPRCPVPETGALPTKLTGINFSFVSCSERFRLAMAVRAQHPPVLETMVIPDTVAMIDLDGNGATPPLHQSALIAPILQDAFLKQPPLNGRSVPWTVEKLPYRSERVRVRVTLHAGGRRSMSLDQSRNVHCIRDTYGPRRSSVAPPANRIGSFPDRGSALAARHLLAEPCGRTGPPCTNSALRKRSARGILLQTVRHRRSTEFRTKDVECVPYEHMFAILL